MNRYLQTWPRNGISGGQSCHSSTCWPFQDGTKLRLNQTHRQLNCMSFAMLVKRHRVLLPICKDRTEQEVEHVTSFVASKLEMTPLKKITLPCLELMGALVGAWLRNNLPLPLNLERNQLKMWSDSTIVLHWIHSSAQRWKPFVANRVTEIQGLTNPELWSHCNGKTNPVDLPTRGQSAKTLNQSQLWRNGRPLLSSTMKQRILMRAVSQMNTELRCKFQVEVQFTSTEQAESLLDLEKYSRSTG